MTTSRLRVVTYHRVLDASRAADAPNPSLLASIAKKLPIVAISRDFLAFEDSFDRPGGWTRLWVTLLPLSSCGSWVDYVYALVSVETGGGNADQRPDDQPQPDDPGLHASTCSSIYT